MSPESTNLSVTHGDVTPSRSSQAQAAAGSLAHDTVHLARRHRDLQQRAQRHGEAVVQDDVVDLRVQLLAFGRVDFGGRRLTVCVYSGSLKFVNVLAMPNAPVCNPDVASCAPNPPG